MLKKEFADVLREITMLGYGLCLICHSKEKSTDMVDADGEPIKCVVPDLPAAAYQITNSIVDIIAFLAVEWEDNKSVRYFYTRNTPTIFAGSRYAYLKGKIPYGYDNLVAAIGEAIEKARAAGANVTDNTSPMFSEKQESNFDTLMEEAKNLWTTLITRDEKNGIRLKEIVRKIFGQDFKLRDAVPAQKDLLELVVYEMRELE